MPNIRFSELKKHEGFKVEVCHEAAPIKNNFEEAVYHVDDHYTDSLCENTYQWSYHRTPSEHLIEKTPKGYRRIRGSHNQVLVSPVSPESKETSFIETNASSEQYPVNISFYSKASQSSGFSNDVKHLETVAPKSRNRLPASLKLASHIELHVSNLDQNIGAKDLRNILTSVFNQHVTVLSVNVHLQGDGHLAAIVRVPSLQDAQYCISQLHRRKLGSKRIMISYDQNSSGQGGTGKSVLTIPQIRARISALLADIPHRRLPLFKFRELYEQRFTSSISLSDLHRLRDILEITDDSYGRSVVFLRNSSSIDNSSTNSFDTPVANVPISKLACSDSQLTVDEMLRCAIHDSLPTKDLHGWAESQVATELPMVFSTLHDLTLQIHTLLQSHGGTIPLASIARCYEMEIGKLNVREDTGVPFEHLISCIKGVEIVSHAGHKRLQWSGKSDDPLHCVNPSLVPQISLFCRELVDLLKLAPQCRIPFSKFIPAYHHHFGRQCRVADYGYTRLVELLESLPHVVHVLGEGSRRYVTLSHRAQMKRFTSDLLRILKAQTSKQISFSYFAVAYEKTFSRSFDPREYGLCDLEDLLVQVAEASVVVIGVVNGESVIGMPKREQTFEEMERTRQFATEVVELLKHAPQCKLEFAKFIPAYHHHFGKQCRVADYGCSKLIELFEAIPETVQILDVESEFEKFVQLTIKQRLRILAEQIAIIIEDYSKKESLFLSDLPDLFCTRFGFALKPDQYEASNLQELVVKLRNYIQVNYTEEGIKLRVIDQERLKRIKERMIRLIYPIPDGCLGLNEFQQEYKNKFNENCPLNFIHDHMEDLVSIDVVRNNVTVVRLTPKVLFSRLVHVLLNENGGRLSLANLESRFLERFGSPIRPSAYGFTTLHALLLSAQNVLMLRGKGSKRYVSIHKHIADLTPPNIPRLPSSAEIKPPTRWLTANPIKSPTGKKVEDDPQIRTEKVASPPSTNYSSIHSILSQMTFNSIWGVPIGLQLSGNPMSSIPTQWTPTLNHSFPFNYWVAAWQPSFSCSVPVTPVALPKLESENNKGFAHAANLPVGTPPPASLLPLPPREMTCADGKLAKSKSVKSRIAAQFGNPTAYNITENIER